MIRRLGSCRELAGRPTEAVTRHGGAGGQGREVQEITTRAGQVVDLLRADVGRHLRGASFNNWCGDGDRLERDGPRREGEVGEERGADLNIHVTLLGRMADVPRHEVVAAGDEARHDVRAIRSRRRRALASRLRVRGLYFGGAQRSAILVFHVAPNRPRCRLRRDAVCADRREHAGDQQHTTHDVLTSHDPPS